MRNRFRKSRCKIISEEELRDDSVLTDIKNVGFGEEINEMDKKAEVRYSDKENKGKIKRQIVLAIIILMILLYVAARLRL